jgi:hypothetical protein
VIVARMKKKMTIAEPSINAIRPPLRVSQSLATCSVAPAPRSLHPIRVMRSQVVGQSMIDGSTSTADDPGN